MHHENDYTEAELLLCLASVATSSTLFKDIEDYFDRRDKALEAPPSSDPPYLFWLGADA